jgi:hypothetical protein
VNALALEMEPPPGYVAFVARNLDMVRTEAAKMAGDEVAGDRLYPDALTDVAMRWGWLELKRRLRGRETAEEYLCRALERRWLAEQARADEEPEEWSGDIRVLGSGESEYRFARRSASAAVRLAPQLAPAARPTFGPVADAAIAWWHAYETRRRRRWIALAVAVVLLVLILARLQNGLDDAPALVLLGAGQLARRTG